MHNMKRYLLNTINQPGISTEVIFPLTLVTFILFISRKGEKSRSAFRY